MQSGRFANGMGGAPPASLSLCRGVNAERDELQALWNGERCPGINDAAFTFIENGSGVCTRVRVREEGVQRWSKSLHSPHERCGKREEKGQRQTISQSKKGHFF